MSDFKTKLKTYYEKNEAVVDVGFFVGGFVFDVFTLSDVDDTVSIVQQLVYLVAIAWLLVVDVFASEQLYTPGKLLNKVWDYRHLAAHFLLGSLLSVYSLYFIKSSSLWASLGFVLVFVGIMVANELSFVQNGKHFIKFSIFTICVFSFFSTVAPVLLGFVGFVPFLLSGLATSLMVYGLFRWLNSKNVSDETVQRQVVLPGALIITFFTLFYFLGLIPPVPLSIKKIGIYHRIEKSDGVYVLSFSNDWWKFWQSGAQDFKAEPGDKINVFVSVYSPTRFSDSVILHWQYYDKNKGWQTSDRIPLQISGGRKEGFRGFASKQNYSEGQGRIKVETTNGSEIGRIYFDVQKLSSKDPNRAFENDVY